MFKHLLILTQNRESVSFSAIFMPPHESSSQFIYTFLKSSVNVYLVNDIKHYNYFPGGEDGY